MLIKRELKTNFKSFVAWTSVLIFILLIVYLIYPSLTNNENIEMLSEITSLFPKEVLATFNMDISGIDTAYGWLKTEGLTFILMINGIYASILGSNILLKEEDSKTIEYLYSLPIDRKYIFISKIIVSLFYILLMIIIIGLFNYVCLKFSGDFNEKQYILLALAPVFSSLPLFSVNLYISLYTRKLRESFGIALSISMISYFLSMISNISENIKFIKYLTVYTLSDIRNIIINNKINEYFVLISLVIVIFFVIIALEKYKKKEFI